MRSVRDWPDSLLRAYPARVGSQPGEHMKLKLILIVLALFPTAGASTASAQLYAAKDAPIAYGHHHLNVTSIAAHKKFFVDTLGGVPITIAGREIVKFPNGLVFLREQK